jgi:RNA polymerase sigma factor (sigma-70 family)
VIKKIFAKIRKKDDQARRILYEMFYDRVYRTAYYITKDPYLAQDVLQETFIKAFRNMNDITDGAKVGAWLSKIAARTAIDILRKKKRWNGTPTEDVYIEKGLISQAISNSVEKEIEEAWIKENLWRIIDKLPPMYRAVIVLKYIEELKDEEIAQTLDIKVGTIKSRLHRAKHQLKPLLRNSGISDGGIV